MHHSVGLYPPSCGIEERNAPIAIMCDTCAAEMFKSESDVGVSDGCGLGLLFPLPLSGAPL